MKRFFSLFFILTLHFSAQSQAGLTASYTQINAPNWEKLMSESLIYDYGQDANFNSTINLSIDYWFRFKGIRIEFFPTLSYAKYSSKELVPISLPITLPVGGLTNKAQLHLADFALNTNIYPFDFFGDCDCPTFSKQDPLFKKGLFVQIATGMTYSIGQATNLATQSTENATDISPNLGLGVGLDIGFSDLITVTPFIRAKRHFNVNWDNLLYIMTLQKPENSPNETNHVTQLEAGIRLGIRWRT